MVDKVTSQWLLCVHNVNMFIENDENVHINYGALHY